MIRIYPVYIIMLVVGTILCNIELNLAVDCSDFSEWFAAFWKQRITIKDLALQIPIIGKYDATLINPPIWTMYAEMQAIVLLPILDFWYRKKRKKWMIFCALIVAVIFNVCHLFPQIVWKWMSVFLIGYTGKVIFSCDEKYVNMLKRNKVAYIVVLLNIFLFEIRNIMPENIRIFSLAISCMMLILVICHNNLINRICSVGWLVSVGNISYEFYLVHFVVLLALRPYALYLPPDIYIASALFISILMSLVLNRCISKPLNKKYIVR